LVFVGLRLRSRLPAKDWSYSVDTDRTDAMVRRTDPLPTSMRAAIIEKVALIGLVGGIFALVLETGATGLQIFGATVFVVVANVGISIWLARRGFEWKSLAVESVVLVVVNATLLSVYATLVGDGRLERTTSLFFGFLLTVLIVLYDRYRPVTPEPSAEREPAIAAP